MEFPDELWLIPIIIGGLFVLAYLAAPVLVYFLLRIPMEPELLPFDPDDPRLPDEIANHFAKVTRELTPIGFEVVAGFALPRHVPMAKGVVLLLAHRRHKDMAIVTAIYTQAPGDITRLQAAYTEIMRRHRDETVQQTNNSSTMNSFKYPRSIRTDQFPQVTDAGELYQLHLAVVDRYGTGSMSAFPLDEEYRGDVRGYFAGDLIDEMESQIESGYVWRSDNEGVYRATLKGAIAMGWNELWPISAMRRARRDRQARRLLAELADHRNMT